MNKVFPEYVTHLLVPGRSMRTIFFLILNFEIFSGFMTGIAGLLQFLNHVYGHQTLAIKSFRYELQAKLGHSISVLRSCIA